MGYIHSKSVLGGGRERFLLTEGKIGDGHVIEDDMEVSGTAHQVPSDEQRDLLTLCD